MLLFYLKVGNFPEEDMGLVAQKLRFTNHVFLLESYNVKFNFTRAMEIHLYAQTQ